MSTGWENVGMIIAKPKNDKANMLETDAQSRITVWTANHLDSVEISKIGLTSIPCGAANESGTKILHASGPGLTLERRDAVMPQTFNKFFEIWNWLCYIFERQHPASTVVMRRYRCKSNRFEVEP